MFLKFVVVENKSWLKNDYIHFKKEFKLIMAPENLVSFVMMFYIMDDYCITLDFENNNKRIKMSRPAAR